MVSSSVRAAAAERGDDLAALKASFRRPASVPFPADNPFSEAKRALGETLFNDPRLSIDGSLACASCHQRGPVSEVTPSMLPPPCSARAVPRDTSARCERPHPFLGGASPRRPSPALIEHQR